MTRLTPKQRDLIRELDEMATLVGINYREVDKYPKTSRTDRLEYARRYFTRGEVVLQYTLADEFLSDVVCDYFFRGRSRRYGKRHSVSSIKNERCE